VANEVTDRVGLIELRHQLPPNTSARRAERRCARPVASALRDAHPLSTRASTRRSSSCCWSVAAGTGMAFSTVLLIVFKPLVLLATVRMYARPRSLLIHSKRNLGR